jgi:hypothetical protein
MPRPAAVINRELAKAGLTHRLVRDPSGYYYVTDVAVSSALYVWRLDPEDLQTAKDHVQDVLAREWEAEGRQGEPFTFR